MNNTSGVNSNSSLLNNNDNKSQTNNTGILSPVGNLFNREPGNDINNVNNNSNNTLSFGNTGLSSNSNENNASMANNGGMFGLNNNTNNMNSNTPSTSNNSMFGNNFGGLNNNLASSMSGSPLNLNGINNKKDVAPAINAIKNVIKDLEGKGYKVLIDENDSDNLYQITIKVDKTV